MWGRANAQRDGRPGEYRWRPICFTQNTLKSIHHDVFTIRKDTGSQITRLQLIQNSLARAVVNAAKSCHVTPVLRCLHWLKINERIEYKLLYSQSPHNQPASISTTSSLFNLLAALALQLWLPWLDHQHHPPYA